MKTIRSLFVLSCTVCFGVLAYPAMLSAQAPKTTLQKSAAINKAKTTLVGESMDEATLIRMMGIDETQAELEDQWGLVALYDEHLQTDLQNTPSTAGVYAIEAMRALNGPSPIRTRSRTGLWQTRGSVDLVELLGVTWSLGSGVLEEEVRNYLVNARADYYRFRLNGFYNIVFDLSDPWDASSYVIVSADRKHMKLIYEIPGNQVSCTANLTSPFGWPDRDVRVTTTVRIEVSIEVTGNLNNPTTVQEFRISLKDTECWNDGILFRETFNERVENEVNAVSQSLPVELGQLLFGSVNTKVKSYVTPSTRELFLDYNASTSTVMFSLDSASVLQPPIAVGALPATRARK